MHTATRSDENVGLPQACFENGSDEEGGGARMPTVGGGAKHNAPQVHRHRKILGEVTDQHEKVPVRERAPAAVEIIDAGAT